MELTDLVNKIATDLANDATEPVEAETELLMSGIVDSLGVINLVTWIEDQIGVQIDPGDVVIENFETPNAIMTFAATLAPQTRPTESTESNA